MNGSTFHRRTLALIGKPVSAGDPRAVREGELRLASRFPPSVREWYADIEGTAILQEFSNDDRALKPHEFEICEIAGQRLVIFMTENQSVCWWAFALDNSDDPQVYVGYYGTSDEPLLLTRKFSDFVYSRVFDFAHIGDPDRYWMREGRVPSADDLKALRQIFSEEISTKEWTGTTAFRFSAPQGHLVIWVGPIPPPGSSRPPALRIATGCCSLPKTRWGCWSSHEADAPGTPVQIPDFQRHSITRGRRNLPDPSVESNLALTSFHVTVLMWRTCRRPPAIRRSLRERRFGGW